MDNFVILQNCKDLWLELNGTSKYPFYKPSEFNVHIDFPVLYLTSQ
jgi:hypothetical protein